MRTTSRLALLALLLTTSGPAAANGVQVYIHNGFYARLGAGPGYVLGSNAPEQGAADADVKGLALSTELAFGTTLAPGLVVGGGSYSMVVPTPTYSPEKGDDVDIGTHHVSGIGPFVDYYFHPQSGGHIQAALLLSGIFVQEKDRLESASGFGFGAMVGGGYEVWVGHEWSIGPLLRVAFYNEAIKGSDSGGKATLRMFAPSLLFAATYH